MPIGAWDNSTRGLDASTALEFERALRIATDVSRLMTIVSIYQASETLYALFDKVCVLSEGRMVYFGPTDQAREYFLSLVSPYVPPSWVHGVVGCHFSQVTDPPGRVVRPGLTPAEDQARPRSSAELAEHLLVSSLMEANVEDINTFNEECATGHEERVEKDKRSAHAEHAKGTRRASPYTVSLFMQARAVMLRRVQIIMGAKIPTLITLSTLILQGVIVGSVFLNFPQATSAYFSRGGVMFLCRAVVLRPLEHGGDRGALRPAPARPPEKQGHALPLVDMPITFTTSAVFSTLLYYIPRADMVFFDDSVFFLFLFTMAIAMKAFFRTIAAAFKSMAGIVLLVLVIYTSLCDTALKASSRTTSTPSKASVPRSSSGAGYEDATLDNQVCATLGSVWASATDTSVVLFKRGSKHLADDGAGAGAADVAKGNAADESAAAERWRRCPS
ncbi:hypothetical protein B0H16DRAFT_1741855 [Mycena metata]|uniref:ABC transporter family G domain-containing protein n=1 Tax=Mycena metata TaxID=1033252 RepID=A0AAD7MGP8_9AGAR|nr:hypothetical protein B0H16DRAFT_1741855 [Mycena metata]